MHSRSKPILRAAFLALLPMALVFPILAVAHFGPTGPAIIWPVVLYAPLAMWMETRAIRILLNASRDGRDPALLAILPLGIVSVFTYTVHGALFILGLPGLLNRFL